MDGADVGTLVAEVYPGLLIGSLRAVGLAESLGVTHVLSVVNFKVAVGPSIQHLQLPLQDEEWANLLQHLPSGLSFVDEAIKAGGRCLVHCQAGVSRSASVVAAYIMKANKLSEPEEALKMMRSTWPYADPNPGFMAQLALFGDMRCSLDLEHPVYRVFCLEQVGRRREEEGYVDVDAFAQLPEERAATQADTRQYRCRKCRRLLCTAHNIVPVDAAMGHRVFRDRAFLQQQHQQGASGPSSKGGSGKGGSAVQQEESSVFVEPMAWMGQAIVGEMQGKLYCPGCQARLGSFNWAGITNTQGAWVTPAFQLHISKMDMVDSKPLVQIRRPLVGPAAAATATAAASDAQPSTTQQQQQGSSAAGSGPEACSSAPAPALCSPAPQCSTAWFTHLVLDCDGVMVDTERDSCESLHQAILEATGFDIPHSFPQDYTEVFGMDVRSCVAHYKEKFNRDWDAATVSERVLQAKERWYRELTATNGIRAFEGTAPLIQKAYECGMQVAVASSGAPEKIQHNLTSSGLAPLLNPRFVVSALEVAAGKPAPDVYVEALRRIGCTDPKRAVVVEDAVNGLKAARGAGAYCMAVTTSLPRDRLQPYADLVLDRLEELDIHALKP